MEAKPLRLAGDTNLLLDWADSNEDVLDAVALLDQRQPQAEWLVSPSVLDELAFLTDSGDTLQLRQSARVAFQQLQGGERFRAILDLPFPSDFIKRVADEIRQQELVPAAEVHDSWVLAEAAFLQCALLMTSDAHLQGVDHELLTLVLNPFDLAPPVVATHAKSFASFSEVESNSTAAGQASESRNSGLGVRTLPRHRRQAGQKPAPKIIQDDSRKRRGRFRAPCIRRTASSTSSFAR